METVSGTSIAEERLIQAIMRWDELGKVGEVVDPGYCPGEGECDKCPAQNELREALDGVKAERTGAS